MEESKLSQRFRKGSLVRLTADAIENYGKKYAGRTFRVESVSTRYMAANEFFAKGKPSGYHPGFDSGSGDALYDCQGLNFSLYDWELK